MHVGNKTVYYYGTGGGGVAYPDQFFFRLPSRLLQLVFNGPYRNDKTPDGRTKAIEKEILGSLETF